MAITAKKQTLKTYRFEEGSLIPEINVREQGKGEYVAYLHPAHEPSRAAELHELRTLFAEKGWAPSSDNREGKPVLRLTGLKNAQELITLLEEKQSGKTAPYIAGKPEVANTAVNEHEPQGMWQKLRMHSLRASGIMYTLGNAFYIMSGISRNAASGKKDWGQIGTGLAFSSGDLLLAAVGGKDDNRQFKSLLKKLKSHMEHDGIEIPPDAALRAETKPKTSFGEKSYDFVHEHINQIKALAEVAGGFMYFRAGKEQKNTWKQATAVIFSLGFGSTLFIEEKKPDPEKLKTAGFMEKTWAFIQEKPLRVAGWSGLSNTLFTTIGALKERAQMDGSHHYRYDLAAAGSMLLGNNLYALSNKSTGGSITTDDLVEDIYGLAAQVLNRVPEPKREAAIASTVKFLGERVELKANREEIDGLLRKELQRLNHENPWFETAGPSPARTEEAPGKWASAAKHRAAPEGWEKAITAYTPEDAHLPALPR